MFMIYCPASLPQAVEPRLEDALEQDGARVHYVGSDGVDEVVIVEAQTFKQTRKLEKEFGLQLAWKKT